MSSLSNPLSSRTTVTFWIVDKHVIVYKGSSDTLPLYLIVAMDYDKNTCIEKPVSSC